MSLKVEKTVDVRLHKGYMRPILRIELNKLKVGAKKTMKKRRSLFSKKEFAVQVRRDGKISLEVLK